MPIGMLGSLAICTVLYILMSAVMTDVSSRVPPRDARVYAIVHEDNHRSLAVCRRHGLTEEMSRPHPSYRRVVTPHRDR